MSRIYFVALATLVVGGLSILPVSAEEHGGHKAEGEKHGHTSPHGGVVKSIGDFHAELVFKATEGKVDLYVLGEDEKSAKTIGEKELTAQVKGHDGKFQAVTLKADPLKGEKEGECSHFSGAADTLKGAKTLEAVVQIPIGGKKYRASFTIGEGHGEEAGGHKKGGHHE